MVSKDESYSVPTTLLTSVDKETRDNVGIYGRREVNILQDQNIETNL